MKDGYAICLNEWALDKEIKNELGLLLIISSLCAEKGFCWASNEYLANLFDIDEAQISKKIAKLVKRGYLSVTYQKRGTEIISREIRLAEIQTTDVKIDNGPMSKLTTDHCQNSQPTVVKNDKYNNTSINNTSINKKENTKKKKAFQPPTLEEVEAYVKEKGLNVNAKKFIDYYEATEWRDTKGNRVLSWKGKAQTWDNRAIKVAEKTEGNPFFELLKEEQDEARRNDSYYGDNESSILTLLPSSDEGRGQDGS